MFFNPANSNKYLVELELALSKTNPFILVGFPFKKATISDIS